MAILAGVGAAPTTTGISTSTITVNRSSTTSQPTAMWPACVCSARASDSTRMSTTVLATERQRPNTIAPAQPQPSACTAAAPSAVATTLCTMAPGIAMRRTASSSSRWNCRPTPNMSRMTPISASWVAMRRIGDEAWRVGTDQETGGQVADDG